MAWLQTIPRAEADGPLAQTYAAMAARPIPPVYQPEHGDAPGIIRAHSLDHRLMQLAFGATGALHRAALGWAERELLSTVTARTNQCFY